MQVMRYNDFVRSATHLHKMPHTGPVYYGTGARPYGAALKGSILVDSRNRVLEFKTPEAAEKKIREITK
jgi:hypothetical protein